MHSVYVSLFAAGLATLVQAQDYTAPTDATWGPLLLPDLTHPVTQGEEFTITWDPDTHPTSGVTVSLVLCKGPSTNCVPQDTAIATGLAADLKQYEWSVPCDLTPGVQATSTGYGMLVIVDGTGEFQYSTQFSVLENKACSGSTGGPTLTSTVTPTSSLGPPGQQTGTAYTGSFTGNGTWTYGPSGTKTATPDSTDSAYTINTYTSDGAGTSTTLYTLPTGSTTPASQTSTGSASGASSFPGAANQLSWNAAGVVVAGAAALFAL